MAKTRRTYGWGCLTCNMQCAGFQDADGAWQEASIHTTSSGHVTDTFFRVDTQVTTIYPQRQEVRVLTALEPPTEERSGHSDLQEHLDPARADFTPELIEAADRAAEKYVKEFKDDTVSAKTPEDKVS